MTVNSSVRRNDYAGSGITGPYSYTFRIFEASDLRVSTVDSSGVETVLSYPTDYSVTNVGNRNGGAVTFTIAVPSGTNIILQRVLALVQETDIRNQGPYYPETLEDALDRVVMIAQQVNDGIVPVFRAPATVNPTSLSLEIPNLTPNAYLRVNNAGNGLDTVSSVVSAQNFIQSGTGAITRSANTKMAERLTPDDFGAVPDGSTPNDTAFAALAAYVNGISGSKVPVIEFLPGEYAYSSGLSFTREVHITGEGSWINYSGNGKALALGPDGVDGAGEKFHRRYEIEGLGFKGGASMTHGIYVNAFLTQPRFRGLRFDVFGNATAYALFCQSSNWNVHVLDCSFSTNSDTTGDRNFVRLNGATAGGSVDNGQSRLTMLHCLATNQGFGGGVAVYVNGIQSMLDNNKLESFGVNVWLAAYGYQTVVTNNYFEVRYGPCIQYGDPTGAYDGMYGQDYRITQNRCNMHHSDFLVSYPFMAPATANTGMQFLRLRDNVLDDNDPSVPMVVQNSDKASQTGNQASGNRGFDILHTGGVVDWTGDDGP